MAQPTEAPPAAAPATAPKPPAELPEVVVYLKEGQRVSGLLVSADAGEVVVRISGINTKFAVEAIERYEVLPPIMERYQELRRTIGKEPEEILRLAQWLQSREQYALALSEVQRALEDRSDARRGASAAGVAQAAIDSADPGSGEQVRRQAVAGVGQSHPTAAGRISAAYRRRHQPDQGLRDRHDGAAARGDLP